MRNTSKKLFTTSILFVGILVFFSNGIAQEGKENPHGPLQWDCMQCHTTQSWDKLRSPMLFSHDETGFELEGLHQQTDCLDCHQSLRFNQVGTACADCHTDVHREQFGNDCQSCHTPRGWNINDEVKELHAQRGFPLSGVHAIADCQACHLGEQVLEFSGTSAECSNCHISDFMQTSDPEHAKAGFGMECMNCHQPMARKWQESTFQHPEVFQLRGAHMTTDCNSCHNTSFAGTPRECVSCHASEYQNSSNPPHDVYGFPQECQACHNETRWNDAIFDHLQRSGFELRGAHNNILCNQCHVNNQISGLPRDCIGCHNDDFNSVGDPNHVSGNFPTDCLVCHNENAWAPADFNHDLTGFQLTGRHATLQCNDCHSDGYTNTPTDCYSCHQADYDNTTDPNHQAANFPTDCQQCHNTSHWNEVTWDHDGQYFPIYSGKHKNKWDTCADCHVQPNNYAVFECIFCHEHNQQRMDDKHSDVGGYQYNSQACYDCHPNGEEKMGMFFRKGLMRRW